MYWFSMAAIINYHKLNGLRQHRFIIYCSEGQKYKISQEGCVPFGGSRGESVYLHFPAFESDLNSLALIILTSSSTVTSPLTLTLLLPYIKTLVTTLAHLDIDDNLSISNSLINIICKVPFSM